MKRKNQLLVLSSTYSPYSSRRTPLQLLLHLLLHLLGNLSLTLAPAARPSVFRILHQSLDATVRGVLLPVAKALRRQMNHHLVLFGRNILHRDPFYRCETLIFFKVGKHNKSLKLGVE